MNICIVTVYNSLNFGSYLQAFALKTYLEGLGHNVSFLETKARNTFNQTLKSTIKNTIKLDFQGAKFHIDKYNKFKQVNNKFKLCKNIKSDIDKQDIFIFGSDEIWNISREDFRKYPIFMGIGINNKKLISYAPSINTTKLETLKKYDYIKEALERFDRLSVRDNYSYETLSNIITNDMEIVLDPTFLIDEEIYKENEEICSDKDYILVYSYGHNMNKERIRRIKEFAKNKNKKLISVGFDLDWCDSYISTTPFGFLSYIRNADYIITDTFHGTVFSIIYNKNFVTYGESNTKIVEIANQFKLYDRNIKSNDELEEVFNRTIDYEQVNSLIKEYKNKSLRYLNDSINLCNTRKDNKHENIV